MQIFQARRRGVLTLKWIINRKRLGSCIREGTVVKSKNPKHGCADAFPRGLNFLVALQHFTAWWLNLNISLRWLVWPPSVASGGWSDSWPRADLLDTVNISSATKHLPESPWAVRHQCSSHISQTASLNARWCQCSQCLKTAWVANSECTCRDDLKTGKRVGLTTTLQFGGTMKNSYFRSVKW